MTVEGLKYFVFASIISADNDRYEEDVKQDIISRFGTEKTTNKSWNNYNWEYILEPLNGKEDIEKLIKLLTDGEE